VRDGGDGVRGGGDGVIVRRMRADDVAALDAIMRAAAGFVPRRMLRHMIRGTGATPSLAVFGRANLGQG
jgi:hypothetical protein